MKQVKSATLSLSLGIIALFISVFLLVRSLTVSDLAYIDSARLLNEYQGMIDARAAYEKKSSTWQANMDTLQNEVTRQVMDYEKSSSAMTAKEKELSKELIKTKQKQFRDYQQAIQTQSQQEDARMTQEVLDKVNTFLKTYGEVHDYKIILGMGQGNILYAKEGLDITDQVIKDLNNHYQGL